MSTPIGGGRPPVETYEDVLAEYPAQVQSVETAPVRDAIAEAQAAGFIEYQIRAEELAGQCDPLRATGIFLDSLGQDRDTFRLPLEGDAAYRARTFAAKHVVTFDAIIAEVASIIAGYTTTAPRLFENLDGWFVHNSDPSVWDSFVGAPPNYPDRDYTTVPEYEPQGAVPFSDALGRGLVLVIPSLDHADDLINYVIDGDEETSFFVSDGTSAHVHFLCMGIDRNEPSTVLNYCGTCEHHQGSRDPVVDAHRLARAARRLRRRAETRRNYGETVPH